MDGVTLAVAVVAVAVSYLRWLRVAQREHYLPGMTSLFARRWWTAGAANRAAFLVAVAGLVVSAWLVPVALAAIAVAIVAPFGLSVRGRTSRLAWTGRLRRLAVAGGLVALVVVALAGVFGLHAAVTAGACVAVLAPLAVDLALWLVRPVEARLLRPYVDRARRRLDAVRPRVIAITGSYGKTTTKGYVAHLVAGAYSVVASPASFNNTVGLARAVNEHLGSGTQVFVAEMGTYGRGEIAEMCHWAPPEVAVITAIGPVHLERMRSLEAIAEAKAEIIGPSRVAVLNVDYPLLAELATKAEESGKTVWRCSSGAGPSDVQVSAAGEGRLDVKVTHVGLEMEAQVSTAPGVEPGNVACAVAAALSIGVPAGVVAQRLNALPGAANRRSARASTTGAVVIDDTYNSNPAGARAALELLAALGSALGKKVVVTPGMVELGPLQAHENAEFAAHAGATATQLLVVGRTNARALLAGARAGGLPALAVRNRPAAVNWVAAHVGPGDAVLYENDLPDHYP